MNAVFFEVDSDSVTKRVHQARRKVLTNMPALPEYDLFGYNAFASDVSKTHSQAKSFGLFSGMGHGGPNEFTGESNLTIYDTKDSRAVNYTTKSAIVHLYSCECGQQLGPHLVVNGAKAFIGYTNLVSLPSTPSLDDEFVKVAGVIDRSILNGDSAATTKMKADQEFTTVNARLSAPNSIATARDVARFRLNNIAMVGPWIGSQYGSF